MQKELRQSMLITVQCVSFKSARPKPPLPPPPKQTCFHLHLAFKLKGINIENGGGEGGVLGLFFFTGILGSRDEFSIHCLNLLQLLVASANSKTSLFWEPLTSSERFCQSSKLLPKVDGLDTVLQRLNKLKQAKDYK